MHADGKGAVMTVRNVSNAMPVLRALLPAMLAALLAACGGGGGSTRADPPPAAPPPTPPPTVVEPPNPAYGHHLAWTGADVAHEAGFTGAGIRIGVVDSGVNRSHPALAGRVVSNLTYINSNDNNLSVDDVVGHGTAVAQVIAGTPFGQWPGGIAPGAEIVSARIISDEPPEDDGSGEGNEVNGALGLAPIHRDLISRGVRIMNNSWGGLYWTNPNVTAQIAAEYRPFIIDNGGLVVFSTGNSGFADPSDTAALPSQLGNGGSTPAADLERGWLAVAALDGDDPTQLADYSNACGIAMDYCLVAPGTVVVTGTDDAPDQPEYWQWRGTSFSAPIVSGAAALVWEAFPYFDNDLVRQTLLGTANDLGATGVDAVFGYGSLDIGAAINGPARFDWGDVTVDFDGIESTWGNSISGDGGLIKEGDGTLVLAGYGDYRGDTRINGGTLRLDQVLANSSVYVGLEGTLTGNGWVMRDVENQGTLRLDTNGSITISGNYLHGPDARLAIELPRPLYIDGTGTIEGGEVHVIGLVGDYVANEREEVLVAYGGLTGRFDGLTAASGVFLEASLDYDEYRVWLDIERLDVAMAAKSFAGITAAGQSSAQRIENAFDRIDEERAVGGSAISGDFIRIAGDFQRLGDEAKARAALDSLSGESHSLATTLTFDAIDMGRRALSSRLASPDIRGDRAGAWKQVLGRGGQAGFGGGDFSLDGWLIGRDQPLGAQSVAGFAFGEVRADDRVGANRDRSRDRQAHGQLYAARLHGDAYAMARFGFGRFERDIQRELFDGDGRQDVFSRYTGRYATWGVEAGRRHDVGGTALTMYLGAERTRLHNDGFRETGDTGFALHADAARMSRTQAIAGLRAARDWRGLGLRGYAEWQQTLDAEGFDVAASFTGVDSWSPLPPADAAKSGGLFGLGIDAWLSRNARLAIDFDQRFGPRGDEGMGSVRYVFGF